MLTVCPVYPAKRETPASHSEPESQRDIAATAGAAPYPAASSDRRISAQRMNELRENDDIREFLFIAQRYLGKLLSPSEAQKLLYFYDELHFTTDLLEYLIEYCVSKDHKSIRYIEKVALAWYDEGITTVKAARQSVSSYHRDYYEILKAIGQGGRHPIDAEITLMKKWIETYSFPMEIIREACTRTVLNTKQPSLKYTDYFIVNEIECCELWNLNPRRTDGALDAASIRAAMEKTLLAGVRKKVIVHASEACFCLSRDGGFTARTSLELAPEAIRGSVGAGDAFAAGALHAIYNGKSDEYLLEFASAAAACSLFCENAVDGMRSKEDIEELMQTTARK